MTKRVSRARPRVRATSRKDSPPSKGGRVVGRTSAAKPRRTPADGAQLSPAAEETRNRLLDAGEAEFGRFGFEGARLDRIAQSVGVKTPLIHHYFNGKDALYHAVVERALDALSLEVTEVLSSFDPDGMLGKEATTAETLRPFGETLVRLTQHFFLRHEPIFAILRQEARSGRSTLRGSLIDRVRPAFEAVIALIDLLRTRGVVNPTLDPRHLFVSIVAMAAYPSVETLFVDAIWPAHPNVEVLIEARAREITALALNGMLVDSAK